jgi:hypothetical protein
LLYITTTTTRQDSLINSSVLTGFVANYMTVSYSINCVTHSYTHTHALCYYKKEKKRKIMKKRVKKITTTTTTTKNNNNKK